jgi:hypothetical protein
VATTCKRNRRVLRSRLSRGQKSLPWAHCRCEDRQSCHSTNIAARTAGNFPNFSCATASARAVRVADRSNSTSCSAQPTDVPPALCRSRRRVRLRTPLPAVPVAAGCEQ